MTSLLRQYRPNCNPQAPEAARVVSIVWFTPSWPEFQIKAQYIFENGNFFYFPRLAGQFCYSRYVWTRVKYDSKTQRVDEDFLRYGEKYLSFENTRVRVDKALRTSLVFVKFWRTTGSVLRALRRRRRKPKVTKAKPREWRSYSSQGSLGKR